MSVEVKIEMGHRAVMRDKPTEEGFTHDWTVFVRGAEGNSIDCFVEKVVFHLHESFPKPKRVIKEPPYSVSESGYAGFMMPIDVYFRTKEEPKRVTFKYDLYLRLQAQPVCNIRIEKLTFQNPSDDFRNKLLKAGGFTGVLSGTAAGASLSTQACAPPLHPPPIDEHLINPPKPVAPEKKPKPPVPCKEIKSNQPTPPKPSQPFTDIFGAPIRTKNSPDPSGAKSKESGHSSQTKSKNTPNSSSTSSGKEGKSSSKESHKSKDSHYSNKETAHPNKEAHSTKDTLQSKDTHHLSKEVPPEKDPHHSSKDLHSSKESHHSSKENLHKVKDHHKKEGHKRDHHSVKEGKTPKESGHSKDNDSKSSKSSKSDKDLIKSGTKKSAPSDSHSSHGSAEKKKKISPIPSESSEKSSSSTSKHKIKDSKEKTEKSKIKSLGNSVKKEKERPKSKSSPAVSELVETKEMPKPKPISPKLPVAVLKPPSPPAPKPLTPDSCSLDSGSDESHKSFNKAHYSSPGSPASSISESSLHGAKPLDFMGMSYPSVISPLSNEEPVDEDFSPPPKRKLLSPASMDESSQESKNSKNTESRSMPKLNKKHSHHKSSKSKSDNFHRGNGSINSDISMHHSPSPDNHNNNTVNNSAYREELLELQRIIMASNDGKLLQKIVDVIEKTGKYEVTNTTFDFDLCTLDYAIIQEIKRCLTKNCDNCF